MAPNNTTTLRFEIMGMRIELGWIGIWSIWSVSGDSQKPTLGETIRKARDAYLPE
jgi:hypothetical protein